MPEYLAPGVFVEEVSFRSKSIEGVPTSTTGYVGLAHYGPVQYPGGPTPTEPRLVTSYVEFERIYGKLDELSLDIGPWVPYLAHAARAFFLNGGRRLYVSRIYRPIGGVYGVAEATVAIPTTPETQGRWRARWPGKAGNVAVTVQAIRSGDVGDHSGSAAKANIVRHGAVLEVVPASSALPKRDTPIVADNLRVLQIDTANNNAQTFLKADGTVAPPAVTDRLLPVEVNVAVTVDSERIDVAARVGLHPNQRRWIARIFDRDDPEDEDAVVWFSAGM